MILEEYLNLSYFAQSSIEHNYSENLKGTSDRPNKKIDKNTEQKKPDKDF